MTAAVKISCKRNGKIGNCCRFLPVDRKVQRRPWVLPGHLGMGYPNGDKQQTVGKVTPKLRSERYRVWSRAVSGDVAKRRGS